MRATRVRMELTFQVARRMDPAYGRVGTPMIACIGVREAQGSGSEPFGFRRDRRRGDGGGAQ
ncbi:hypothetical protein JCM13591A_35880 [Microbacterium xylanilyticum]